MKKAIIIYFVVFILIIAGLVGGLYAYVKTDHPDKYGYVHNPKDDKDKELREEYLNPVVLVNYENIEDVTGRAYSFITEALPVIKNANVADGRQYVTFKLLDGTGIYFAKNYKNTLTGIHGEIDSEGIVTEDKGYVVMNGMNLNYELAPAAVSKESKDLAEYIPEEFQTDGLYVTVLDDMVGITISSEFTNKAKADADYVYESIRPHTDKKVVIVVNEVFSFKYGFEDEELVNEPAANTQDLSANDQ